MNPYMPYALQTGADYSQVAHSLVYNQSLQNRQSNLLGTTGTLPPTQVASSPPQIDGSQTPETHFSVEREASFNAFMEDISKGVSGYQQTLPAHSFTAFESLPYNEEEQARDSWTNSLSSVSAPQSLGRFPSFQLCQTQPSIDFGARDYFPAEEKTGYGNTGFQPNVAELSYAPPEVPMVVTTQQPSGKKETKKTKNMKKTKKSPGKGEKPRLPSVDELMNVFKKELAKGITLKNPWQVNLSQARQFCVFLRKEILQYRQEKGPTKNPRKGSMISAGSEHAFGKNLYIRGSGLKPGMASYVLQEVFHFACQSQRYTRESKARRRKRISKAPAAAVLNTEISSAAPHPVMTQ